MSTLYLVGLLVGIAGMVVLDLRFRLFFRRAPLRAATVMVLGIAFFLFWDVLGIRLDVFFPGPATIVTGVMLAPGLPLEEVFFLTLLCYTAMNAYGWFDRGSRSARRSRTRLETATRTEGLETRRAARGAPRPTEERS